jgi:hypothetical protein
VREVYLGDRFDDHPGAGARAGVSAAEEAGLAGD